MAATTGELTLKILREKEHYRGLHDAIRPMSPAGLLMWPVSVDHRHFTGFCLCSRTVPVLSFGAGRLSPRRAGTSSIAGAAMGAAFSRRCVWVDLPALRDFRRAAATSAAPTVFSVTTRLEAAFAVTAAFGAALSR